MAKRKNSHFPTSESVQCRSDKRLVTMEVQGSDGQTYTIEVPPSYKRHVPKRWEWDSEKYLIAQLLAEGHDISKIPEHPNVTKSRRTIQSWLYHPEFRSYVEESAKELGESTKLTRIAMINRLIRIVFRKIIYEIDKVQLNSYNVGMFLKVFARLCELIAKEKEELVEKIKIEQESKVDVSGSFVNVGISLDEYLAKLPDDERENLEKEFDKIADHYIRQLRGDLITEQ